MGNPTAPPWLPELIRGPNGWSGRCDDFRVVDNVINIRNSDANSNHTPSAEQRERQVDDEGVFQQHVQLAMNEPIYQLWMNKIGPYLGDWVLGKGRNASPPWKLLKFPEGYTLWLHKKGVETDPANPRIDAYLYGARRAVFRSPMEFVEHAIWLMRGKVGLCLCKYCTLGQNQLDIDDRLDRVEPAEDEGDVDVGSGNGSSGGGQPSSSRRRGTGAQARRARRARRDRSPPIMAKDYRVGNDSSAPAPGPA